MIQSFQYRRVDCDIVMDAIADPEAQSEVPLRLSKTYQRSGVALAVPSEDNGITGFDSPDRSAPRRRVLQGSLAHMYLEQRGARTIPFGFEDDMLSPAASWKRRRSAAQHRLLQLGPSSSSMRLIYAYDAVPELSWQHAVGKAVRRAPARGDRPHRRSDAG